MFKVKYLNSIKNIQIPTNLNDFKLKVAHQFGINSDFDIFIKNDEIDFEVQIFNQYDYDLNIQDLINSNIYILIKSKYDFQSYFNQLTNNSKNLDEIEKKINNLIEDMKTISFVNKINNVNKKKDNNIDKIVFIPKKNSGISSKIEVSKMIDPNVISDYSIIFLNNNEKISRNISYIKTTSPQPIEFTIYIKNNNQNDLQWPDDTILKCKNDNSEIFFYHCKWNKTVTNFNGEICSSFEIILNFKSIRNIGIGKYSCRFFLISDKIGRIGNNYGQLFLEIYKDLEDINDEENNSDFFNGYGKVKMSVIK